MIGEKPILGKRTYATAAGGASGSVASRVNRASECDIVTRSLGRDRLAISGRRCYPNWTLCDSG